MKKSIGLLFVTFALSAVMAAQTKIPAGTIIPVELNSAVKLSNAKPGEPVTGRVAQDIPGTDVKHGDKVTGQVVSVNPAQGSQPATIGLRFDKVEVNGQAVPIVTSLRALASWLEVDSAQTPISGTDRGTQGPWNQTLNTVGGNDVVYRGAGTVNSGTEQVGESVHAGNWGSEARVAAVPDTKCRGEVAGNANPQALWVFSHDACGIFGFSDDTMLQHAGRTAPVGEFVIATADHGFQMRSGSAMLLRVNGPETPESATK